MCVRVKEIDVGLIVAIKIPGIIRFRRNRVGELKNNKKGLRTQEVNIVIFLLVYVYRS